MKENRRILELDTLRGLAAIMVILYHYTSRFAAKFDYDYTTKPINFYLGFYGVELFFIISGFVIFMTVDKVGDVKEFAKRRFIRLFPTFWICMIITYIIISLVGPNSLKVSPVQFLLNFTMVPHWLGAKAVDGVYWTLAVELIFYFTMAALLATKLVKYIDYITLGLIILLCGAALVIRFTNEFYFCSLFIAGINFYKIWSRRQSLVNYINIGLCLLLAVLSKEIELISISFVFYALFFLLVYGKTNILLIKPLIWVGQISYAWYLLHQNIGHTVQLALINAGINNYFLLLLIPLILTVILAYVVTYFVEKPIIRMLNKKLLYN